VKHQFAEVSGEIFMSSPLRKIIHQNHHAKNFLASPLVKVALFKLNLRLKDVNLKDTLVFYF